MRILIFLLLLFSGCNRISSYTYDKYTSQECDSLVKITTLSPRTRAQVLVQYVYLHSPKELNSLSPIFTEEQADTFQHLLYEALAIAPADMKTDVKISILPFLLMRTFRDDTKNKALGEFRQLIGELATSEMTPGQKITYRTYKRKYYWKIGAYDEAVNEGWLLIHEARTTGDRETEARILTDLAQNYLSIKDYANTLKYLNKRDKIGHNTPELQKNWLQANACRVMTYSEIGEHQKALQLFKRNAVDTLNNSSLAEFYLRAGKFKETIHYLQWYKKQHHGQLHTNTLINLRLIEADANDSLGLYAEAHQLRREAIAAAYQQALSFRTQFQEQFDRLSPRTYHAICKLAQWEWLNGNKNTALVQLDSTIEKICRRLQKTPHSTDSFQKAINDLCALSSGYHLKMGNYQKALDRKILQDSLMQSCSQAESLNRIKKEVTRQEVEMLNLTISQQQSELSRIHYSRLFFISLATIFAISILILILYFHHRQYLLNLLYSKQKELEQMQSPLCRQRYLASASPAQSSSSTPGRENTDSPTNKLFHKIEHEMRTQRLYANPDFNLENLTHLFASNRSYVSATINQCTGMNFSQWLNRLRLEHVITHIHETDVETLAQQAGFASRTSLYRYFKAHTGLTIKQYIKREKK